MRQYKDENGVVCDPFEKDRYKEYDDDGRKIAEDFLVQFGYVVSPNDGKDVGKINYKQPDLKAKKEGQEYTFEVEVKRGKNDRAWSAMIAGRTVHIPARKTHIKTPTAFILVKYDFSEIVMVQGESVTLCLSQNNKNCKIITKSFYHKKTRKNMVSQFCEIPCNLSLRYMKHKEKWVKLKW